MLPLIHHEPAASVTERTTQTRMDARLARRVALHHTIHLQPAPAQMVIFNDQDRQSSGGVGDACAARRTSLSAAPARATQASPPHHATTPAPTDVLLALRPYEPGYVDVLPALRPYEPGYVDVLPALRSYEPGYVMEPLVLKKGFVASGASTAIEMPGEEDTIRIIRNNESREEQEDDEDSTWLNDRVLPRQASVRHSPILKEQSEGTMDQKILTCWI
jgi:hypothetical protein